ncbi:MAG: hypothetical protein DMF69_19130, partial [Acidobacteria bacterium]
MSDRWSRLRFLRVLPFLILSTISFWVAAGLSAPRKTFYLDLNLSPAALIDSLGKAEHWKASALVFALAWLAVGNSRLILALGLAMGVGLVWEFLEATAVGHTGRLSDLAPDLLSALCSLFFAFLLQRWL